MKELMAYMKMVVKARKSQKTDLKYSCFEDFVLANGREFKIEPGPVKFRMGEARQCFMNSFHLSQIPREPSLIYCEGFAMGVIPLLHAWCVDSNGNVYDPTWNPIGTAYFGVPFDEKFVMKTALARRKFGLIDDWQDGFPLLLGGEDFLYKGEIR